MPIPAAPRLVLVVANCCNPFTLLHAYWFMLKFTILVYLETDDFDDDDLCKTLRFEKREIIIMCHKTAYYCMYAHSSICRWSLSSIISTGCVCMSDIRSLDFVIFRFLMILFQSTDKDIINDCAVFIFKVPSERIYIIAKTDLTRHSVTFEVIVKCWCSK